MTPNQEQVRIMRHALGYDVANSPYRNYYTVPEGTDTHKHILELCRENLMRQAQVQNGPFLCYMVTNDGKARCKK